MKATFTTFAKATKFVELFIEGQFGEGLTLSDFTKYDKKHIKEVHKFCNSAYIVIRTTGTQNSTCVGNWLCSERQAIERAQEFHTSRYIVEFEKGEDKTINVRIEAM